MTHALFGLAVPLWVTSGSGYLASALVLTTFCMSSMLWLRMTAIGSNVAFIFYAAVADIRPVLLLHSVLLPVNVYRLAQIRIAIATSRRLLVAPDTAVALGHPAEPHFLSSAAVADPGAALPLAEREQERAMRLLVGCLPSEAATASGIDPAAAAAVPDLLNAIDGFLAALAPGNPTPAQLAHMTDLHSRNDVLRAVHETLVALDAALGAALAKEASVLFAGLASSVSEGLGALLLHAEAAVHSRDPADIDVLLRTTQDRSALVERIRQEAIAGSVAGTAADYRTIYTMTALYERCVWLLHRYGVLLDGKQVAIDADDARQPTFA